MSQAVLIRTFSPENRRRDVFITNVVAFFLLTRKANTQLYKGNVIITETKENCTFLSFQTNGCFAQFAVHQPACVGWHTHGCTASILLILIGRKFKSQGASGHPRGVTGGHHSRAAPFWNAA